MRSDGFALFNGAVTGGVGSVLGGGNFWMGAGQGLMVTAFNFLAHKEVSATENDNDDEGCHTCPKKGVKNQIYHDSPWIWQKDFWTWDNFIAEDKYYIYSGGKWVDFPMIAGTVPISLAGETSTLKSLPDAFKRFSKFTHHFNKHAKNWSQWGSISKVAYYNRAIKLADSNIGGKVVGFVSKQGWTFKYNKSTGEFLTIHPKGHIETFFRPKAGMDYYLKQLQLYGK